MEFAYKFDGNLALDDPVIEIQPSANQHKPVNGNSSIIGSRDIFHPHDSL